MYAKIQAARASGALTFVLDGRELDIDHAASVAWFGRASDAQEVLATDCASEAIAFHDAWRESFFRGSWAEAVRTGNISRKAYVSTLGDLHYYVRDTTRLIASAVAAAGTRELRRHWARHMGGEVNHERLLERDLAALGATAWAWTERSPGRHTKMFASVQQAAFCGLDPDPISALACPLTAEGVSAAMTSEHIEGLHAAIRSWDVDPARASSFLTSHVHTDGDEGGAHHAGVVDAIRAHVRDEPTLARFLSVQRAAQDSFLAAFDSHVLTWPLTR